MFTPKIPQESEENKDKGMKSPDMSFEAKLTEEQLQKLFDKLDFNGLKDWSNEDQDEVWKLIKDFGFLFALNDLDLGKTSIVKHTIKLIDYTAFKERYCRIPPHQVEEVRNIYKKCYR